MTPTNGAVRVLVRETALGKLYASSPDLPGMHVYARDEKQLEKEIEVAIREMYEVQGKSVAAMPEPDQPSSGEQIWRIIFHDNDRRARFCA